MRGYFRKRSKDSWTVTIELPRDLSGKRRQRTFTVTGTKKDAEARAAELIASLSKGGYVDFNRRTTVAEYLLAWLDAKRSRVTAKTLQRYTSIVNLHLNPVLGAIRLVELRKHHVESAITAWSTNRRRDKKSGALSARSVHHIFMTLNTALREARIDGYIAANPCEFMKAPRAMRKEMTALDGTAARLILAAFKDSEIEMIVAAALGTGLRRGELLGLRWGDVNLDSATITVQRSLERVSGVTRFKEPKTPRSRRTVVMPKFVAQSMRKHRLTQAQRLLQLGLGRPTESTIVFDRLGEPWNPATFSSMFHRGIKRLKAHVRFHDLRHSFASIALSAGTDLKAISDALGHSAISTTADLYAHLFASVKREAAARMDAALGDEAEGSG